MNAADRNHDGGDDGVCVPDRARDRALPGQIPYQVGPGQLTHAAIAAKAPVHPPILQMS